MQSQETVGTVAKEDGSCAGMEGRRKGKEGDEELLDRRAGTLGQMGLNKGKANTKVNLGEE